MPRAYKPAPKGKGFHGHDVIRQDRRGKEPLCTFAYNGKVSMKCGPAVTEVNSYPLCERHAGILRAMEAKEARSNRRFPSPSYNSGRN